jgi:hypothetical protein
MGFWGSGLNVIDAMYAQAGQTLGQGLQALVPNGTSSGLALSAYLANNRVFNPLDLAAVGNGISTNDQIGLQAAIDQAMEATVQFYHETPPVAALGYAMPVVRIPARHYKISDSIQLYQPTLIWADHGAVIEMIDPTKDIFVSGNGVTYPAGAAYVGGIKGLRLEGGKIQLNLTRPNLDVGLFVIEACEFSGGDEDEPAIYLDARSGLMAIKQVRVQTRPFFLDQFMSDVTMISHSWVNGYGETGKKPANSRSYRVREGKLGMLSVLHVPEQETEGPSNTATRWIDLESNAQIGAVNTQFGGENAGFPVVYTYGGIGKTTAYPYNDGSAIEFLNCQLSCGNSGRADKGVVVFKTDIPHRITIIGGDSINDAPIINDSVMESTPGGAATTLSAFLASVTTANRPLVDIEIAGVVGAGITQYVPELLRKYARWTKLQPNGLPNLRQSGSQILDTIQGSVVTGDIADDAGVSIPLPMLDPLKVQYSGFAKVTNEAAAAVQDIGRTVGVSYCTHTAGGMCEVTFGDATKYEALAHNIVPDATNVTDGKIGFSVVNSDKTLRIFNRSGAARRFRLLFENQFGS